jgi:hypothetical protein
MQVCDAASKSRPEKGPEWAANATIRVELLLVAS